MKKFLKYLLFVLLSFFCLNLISYASEDSTIENPYSENPYLEEFSLSTQSKLEALVAKYEEEHSAETIEEFEEFIESLDWLSNALNLLLKLYADNTLIQNMVSYLKYEINRMLFDIIFNNDSYNTPFSSSGSLTDSGELLLNSLSSSGSSLLDTLTTWDSWTDSESSLLDSLTIWKSIKTSTTSKTTSSNSTVNLSNSNITLTKSTIIYPTTYYENNEVEEDDDLSIQLFDSWEYILRDDSDYDLDWINEWCNEELNWYEGLEWYDNKKCILYVYSSNLYITPRYLHKQLESKDANKYCNNLVVNNISDWFLPDFKLMYRTNYKDKIVLWWNRYTTSDENIHYGDTYYKLIDGDKSSYSSPWSEYNTFCVSYILKAYSPCKAESCLAWEYARYYVLNNNMDYDWNWINEWCNEDLSYDKDKCILYDANRKYYISPSIFNKYVGNKAQAISFCSNLEIWDLTTWQAPLIATFKDYLIWNTKFLYNLDLETAYFSRDSYSYNFDTQIEENASWWKAMCVLSDNYTESEKCFRDVHWYNDSKCTELYKTRNNRWPANSTHSDGSFFCNPNPGNSPYWNWGPCERRTVRKYTRY